MTFRTRDTSLLPRLTIIATLLGAVGAPPAGAQAVTERYTPQEYVARLLAQGPGETVRYSAAITFSECPHESPWRDERISDFVRGAAASALFREHSEAEQTQLLIQMRAEGVGVTGVAMRQAILRRQWTEGYLAALAEAFESRPDWNVVWTLMWDAPTPGEPVSPAIRERFLEALWDAANNPRDDWPEEAVSEILRVLRWAGGIPPGDTPLGWSTDLINPLLACDSPV